MSKLNTFLTGTVGTALVELPNQIDMPEIDHTNGKVSLIIQIVIAIATLFKMFKKEKRT